MVKRIPPHNIQPASTNGYRLVTTGGKALWVPESVPAGGLSGQILAKASGADYDTAWVDAPSGGGGSSGVILLESGASVPGGTAIGTIVFEKAPPPVTWDFRGLSALPSGWTRRGVASETFDAQGMTATYSAGQGHEINTPGGTATAGTLEAKLVTGPTASVMLGPIIHAGTGGIGAQSAWYSGPSGNLILGVNASWQYDSSFNNAGGTPNYPVWFRVRSSAPQVFGSHSFNGTSWSTEAALPKTVSIAKLSVGSIFGSSSMKLEYVKWMPGGGTGGLKGWWNGSVVVPF